MSHLFAAVADVWWGFVVTLAAVQLHNGMVQLGRALIVAAEIRGRKQ